jgi:hypothetical protein
LPSIVSRARVQPRQNGCDTDAITPISPCAVGITPALGDLAGIVRALRLERELAAIRATISRAVTTCERSQWLQRADVHELDEAHDVPVPRKRRARIDDLVSLTPFCTTQLILIGARPAATAAGDAPRAPRAGRSRARSLRRNTASSWLSRLTVIRAALRPRAPAPGPRAGSVGRGA